MRYNYLFRGIDQYGFTRFEDSYSYIRDKAPEIEELESDLKTFLDDYAPIYNYENGTHYRFSGAIDDLTEEDEDDTAY